jgi:hypothetical protein
MQDYKAGDFVPEMGIDGLCKVGAEAYTRAFEIAGQHQGALLAPLVISAASYALSGIASGHESAHVNPTDYWIYSQDQKEIERAINQSIQDSFKISEQEDQARQVAEMQANLENAKLRIVGFFGMLIAAGGYFGYKILKD